MPEIKKQVRLIMCDVDNNNNKFWTGTLYDNNDVHLEWGRVGKASQSLHKAGAGEDFLDGKEKEKLKKGYTPLKTLAKAGTNSTVVVEKSSLQSIAKNQIKTGNPLLEKLIDRLVQANIHQITSSTQIQYDAGTGLFSTPLGIVTKDGIDEARLLLAEIKLAKNLMNSKTKVSEYLRIIPQDIGMKFNIEKIFGSNELIVKQSDLLDSLEASYQALQKPAVTATPSLSSQVVESVFNVKMDIMSDRAERTRIADKFGATSKSMHVSSRLRVKEVYMVEISTVRTSFENGKVVGNVQELWHGTKKANLLSILKTGLKISPPSTAYIAGKMFGNGIYFSDQSTKSLNYAYGYWDGNYDKNCFMFLCDVAMGKSFVPDRSGGSLPKPGYDSTFAMASRSGVMNNEMIVYKDNQVDMKYLIEFEE